MQLVELDRQPIAARTHGDAGAREAPTAVDFAVNVNPFGPAPALVAAAHAADLAAYPDPTAHALRHAFATWLGGTPDEYLFDAGACPILWSAARQLHAKTAQPALIVGPTFSEYAAAAQACGARVFELSSLAAQDFAVDVADVAACARELDAASVYLCNPNNPTGSLLPHADLHHLAEALAPRTLVLDESFLALTRAWRDLERQLPDNVLRVRSLTKDYGLAGLRIGYATGRPELIAALERARAPWATNAPAQAAGLVIPSLGAHLEAQRVQLLDFRQALESELASRGFNVFVGSANFTLARHEAAPQLAGALANHGIRVRDCASFGLPGFVRLAARPSEDRTRLLEALDAVLDATPVQGCAR